MLYSNVRASSLYTSNCLFATTKCHSLCVVTSKKNSATQRQNSNHLFAMYMFKIVTVFTISRSESECECCSCTLIQTHIQESYSTLHQDILYPQDSVNYICGGWRRGVIDFILRFRAGDIDMFTISCVRRKW